MKASVGVRLRRKFGKSIVLWILLPENLAHISACNTQDRKTNKDESDWSKITPHAYGSLTSASVHMKTIADEESRNVLKHFFRQQQNCMLLLIVERIIRQKMVSRKSLTINTNKWALIDSTWQQLKPNTIITKV